MRKTVVAVASRSMFNSYKNFFELFNINESFNINQKNLKAQYLQMQIRYHPDKAKSEDEKVNFLKISALINEAYKTLSNDLTRAEYILKIHDIDLEDRNKVKVNKDILLQALEYREFLEEADSENEISKLRNKITEVQQIIIKEISELFEIKEFQKGAEKVIELKYNFKLIEDINNKLSKLNAIF